MSEEEEEQAEPGKESRWQRSAGRNVKRHFNRSSIYFSNYVNKGKQYLKIKKERTSHISINTIQVYTAKRPTIPSNRGKTFNYGKAGVHTRTADQQHTIVKNISSESKTPRNEVTCGNHVSSLVLLSLTLNNGMIQANNNTSRAFYRHCFIRGSKNQSSTEGQLQPQPSTPNSPTLHVHKDPMLAGRMAKSLLPVKDLFFSHIRISLLGPRFIAPPAQILLCIHKHHLANKVLPQKLGWLI
jgi:hypothetical protein